jgi:hypothetical protein
MMPPDRQLPRLASGYHSRSPIDKQRCLVIAVNLRDGGCVRAGHRLTASGPVGIRRRHWPQAETTLKSWVCD